MPLHSRRSFFFFLGGKLVTQKKDVGILESGLSSISCRKIFWTRFLEGWDFEVSVKTGGGGLRRVSSQDAFVWQDFILSCYSLYQTHHEFTNETSQQERPRRNNLRLPRLGMIFWGYCTLVSHCRRGILGHSSYLHQGLTRFERVRDEIFGIIPWATWPFEFRMSQVYESNFVQNSSRKNWGPKILAGRIWCFGLMGFLPQLWKSCPLLIWIWSESAKLWKTGSLQDENSQQRRERRGWLFGWVFYSLDFFVGDLCGVILLINRCFSTSLRFCLWTTVVLWRLSHLIAACHRNLMLVYEDVPFRLHILLQEMCADSNDMKWLILLRVWGLWISSTQQPLSLLRIFLLNLFEGRDEQWRKSGLNDVVSRLRWGHCLSLGFGLK